MCVVFPLWRCNACLNVVQCYTWTGSYQILYKTELLTKQSYLIDAGHELTIRSLNLVCLSKLLSFCPIVRRSHWILNWDISKVRHFIYWRKVSVCFFFFSIFLLNELSGLFPKKLAPWSPCEVDIIVIRNRFFCILLRTSGSLTSTGVVAFLAIFD